MFLLLFGYIVHSIRSSPLSLLSNTLLMNKLNGQGRMEVTERPYIEDVLDKYCNLKNVTILALGSSYWTPPKAALDKLVSDNCLASPQMHRYGGIQGSETLRDRFKSLLLSKGLSMNDYEVTVTAGANQASMSSCLCLVNDGDNVVVLSPYYFSHKLALQMCGANIHICPFNREDFKPDWFQFEQMLSTMEVKLVIATNPNNPSGAVWNRNEIARLISLCKQYNIWLLVDQTYHEFYFDGLSHVYPCPFRYEYNRIIHIFSMSKSFGMPGWRVGFVVHPSSLSDSIRKIQDTIPTHTTMVSQKLSEYCLEYDEEHRQSQGKSWVETQIESLSDVREKIWSIIEPLGARKTNGAFYFLVPVPSKITEEEAVDILVNQYGILLMLGWPFGAPGYLRLSYGSIPAQQCLAATDKLREGVQYLMELSKQRSQSES